MNPVTSDVSSVIPAGTYSGTLTCGEQSGQVTVLFAANGVPTAENGEALYVGWTGEAIIGGATQQATVTAIRELTNGIAVDYDVSATVVSNGQEYVFAGTATDTYVLVSQDTLDNTYSMILSPVSGDSSGGDVTYDCSAQLTRTP
jgi:hypothetical protein